MLKTTRMTITLFHLLILHQIHALSYSTIRSTLHHLQSAAPPPTDSVASLANARFPRRDGKGDILAYVAKSPDTNDNNSRKQQQQQQQKRPIILLIHEFFGLSSSICQKADALAHDLRCDVIAPDTFRGESSTFIPKCIWLALSTPQDRVNDDLDDVLQGYFVCDDDGGSTTDTTLTTLAVMGFCYGGGKAIRYTTQRRQEAATVVCYGSPLTDASELSGLKGPVCGVFGSRDAQFPAALLDKFRQALMEADVESDVRVYDGVGHAFWSDMESVRRGDRPQADAYEQVTTFLNKYFRK